MAFKSRHIQDPAQVLPFGGTVITIWGFGDAGNK